MKERSGIIKVPLPYVSVFALSLPLFSFLFCIYLSIINNFEKATATHCKVPNLLPSISAAVGEFVPQKYIWRISIALHSFPRFLFTFMYYDFLKRILPTLPTYQILRSISVVCSVLENLSLIGLSFISSVENYGVHKFCFITFMFSSILYMLLNYLLLKDNVECLGKRSERMAWMFKKQLLSVNILSFLLSSYFFYRHNKYCEPYMYTGFAFTEYLVVLSNMGFHMTAYYDFYDFYISVGENIIGS